MKTTSGSKVMAVLCFIYLSTTSVVLPTQRPGCFTHWSSPSTWNTEGWAGPQIPFGQVQKIPTAKGFDRRTLQCLLSRYIVRCIPTNPNLVLLNKADNIHLRMRVRATEIRSGKNRIRNCERVLFRGELRYLAPLGSENISVPYFKQCFFQRGGVLPPRLNQTPRLPVPRQK